MEPHRFNVERRPVELGEEGLLVGRERAAAGGEEEEGDEGKAHARLQTHNGSQKMTAAASAMAMTSSTVMRATMT